MFTEGKFCCFPDAKIHTDRANEFSVEVWAGKSLLHFWTDTTLPNVLYERQFTKTYQLTSEMKSTLSVFKENKHTLFLNSETDCFEVFYSL